MDEFMNASMSMSDIMQEIKKKKVSTSFTACGRTASSTRR